MLHTDIPSVLKDGPAVAEQLCRRFGVSAALKGTCSLFCTVNGVAINPFGTPGMAKGGSGDALTGIMAALLAGRAAGSYAMNDLELMQTACALHGLAGEMAAEKYGERGMLATDLCECIGLVQADAEEENIETSNVRKAVTVIVEHPAGSRDPENRQYVYPLNCGYVQQVLEEENRWQDACVLGVEEPVEWFDGEVKAAVHLPDRIVWAAASPKSTFSEGKLKEELSFLGEIQKIEMF